MKSKQINFYITREDLSEINNFFREKECLVFKGNVKDINSDLTYDIAFNSESIFQVYISKEEYKSRIKFKYLEPKDYHYIDILESYCIEFGIGGFYPYSDKELHRSRFYCVFGYYDNEKAVYKDGEFINWVNDIFKSFKKRFLRKHDGPEELLLSENCLEWIEINKAKLAGGGMKFVLE